MYQIIANKILNRKKVKFSVVLNGEQRRSRILFDDRTGVCLANDGMSEDLVKWIREQANPGLSRFALPDKGAESETEIFTEVFTAEPELVILGGGHVAVPVCKMAALTGFQVTVVEDRPELAVKDRFPDAAEVICQSFEDLSPVLDARGDFCFYVIVTRGHSYDQICLEQVLRREYAYLGVIGSRSKTANSHRLLREHGFQEEEIASVHMPIGLRIGAQTPEEIAVSILAEMIQIKNQKQESASPLAIWEWIAAHPGERAVMAVIIAKSGSAPRGVGSRMLCLPDGRTIGTIGGGVLEYAVIQAAAELKEDEMQVRSFSLSNEKSAELGMVCGGTVRVLMQEIRV